MGYYSDFTLTVENHKDIPEDFLQILKDESGYPGGWVQEGRDTFSIYEVKWYDHEQKMELLTRLHPTLKMELHVRGEDGQEYIIDAFNGVTDVRQGTMEFEDRTLW